MWIVRDKRPLGDEGVGKSVTRTIELANCLPHQVKERCAVWIHLPFGRRTLYRVKTWRDLLLPRGLPSSITWLSDGFR